ncbi:hypothetical protein HDU97_001959 [Phlyctochytrium planicorne]|nr:hypothetical protein HDU97_001959 [Phlyctochytrium planicorne]
MRKPTTAVSPAGWSTSALAVAGTTVASSPANSTSALDLYSTSLSENQPSNAAANASEDPNKTATDLTLPPPRKPWEKTASDENPIPPFGVPAAEVKSRNERVEIRLTLDRSIFVADGEISGRVEIECWREGGVKLGEIGVYLCGFEEVISPTGNVPLRRLFLDRTHLLQAQHLAPTEAVVAGFPDEHGMWNARKGVTTFPFTIKISTAEAVPNVSSVQDGGRLPPIPSSFWCNKVGGVRYIVSATARVKLNIKAPTHLGAYREIDVLEHAPSHLAPIFTSLPALAAETCVEVGGWFASSRGEVSLRAECHVPDAGQESGIVAGSWVAGGIGFVNVDIKNSSKRRIQSIKLSLIRRLKTFTKTAPTPLTALGESPLLNPIHFSRQVVMEKHFVYGNPERSSALSIHSRPNIPSSQLLWTQRDLIVDRNAMICKDWWHGVAPGEGRRMLLDFCVPIQARSIRFAFTVDVSYVIQVSAIPRGCPPINVEIPVTILHPASLLTSLPRLLPYAAPAREKTKSPVVPSSASMREDLDVKDELALKAQIYAQAQEDLEQQLRESRLSGTVGSLSSSKIEGKLVASLIDGQDGFDVVDVTEFPLHDDETPILSRGLPSNVNNGDNISIRSATPSRSGTVIIKSGTLPRSQTLDRHRSSLQQATMEPSTSPSLVPPITASLDRLRPSVSSAHTAVERASTLRHAGSIKRPSIIKQIATSPTLQVPTQGPDMGTWKASMLNELVELKNSLMKDNDVAVERRVGDVEYDDEDTSDVSSDHTEGDEEEEVKGKLGKLSLNLGMDQQTSEIERAIDDLFKNLDA